jgi:hypothetical protein
MTLYDAKGKRVRPSEILPKLDAYFANADMRVASVSDVVEAVAAGRVACNPIPRCGALLQEALRAGLIRVEAVELTGGVR